MSFAELTATQKDEFAASLAVLALFDSQVEVSAENLSAAISAAGVKVSAYVPQLFADLLGRGLDVEKFLAGPSAGAAPAAGAAAAGGAAAEAAPAAAEKEEEEEADLGGGMDMFGGDADY